MLSYGLPAKQRGVRTRAGPHVSRGTEPAEVVEREREARPSKQEAGAASESLGLE